jgi:predicted transcriptional regulator of viral defense system
MIAEMSHLRTRNCRMCWRAAGFEVVDVLGTKVQMADIERGILDSINRPSQAGGVGEVSRIVRNAAKRISWPRLLAHTKRWNESALIQRLGYLLDLHAVPLDATTRVQLRDLVRPDNKIFFGPRKRWGTTGKLVAEWGIIENVSRDVLVERGDGARRPLRLRTRGEK